MAIVVFSLRQMKIVEQNSWEAIAISASFSVLPIIPVWVRRLSFNDDIRLTDIYQFIFQLKVKTDWIQYFVCFNHNCSVSLSPLIYCSSSSLYPLFWDLVLPRAKSSSSWLSWQITGFLWRHSISCHTTPSWNYWKLKIET